MAAIRALHPAEALEIGCGTGLLLSRIAPHASTYWGFDFSSAVMRQVELLKQHQPELSHVVFKQRAADDFSGIQPGQFDTVILNSVIQYFPGADYLVNVLEQAIDAIKPGGHLFVGDVRHLPLLRAFHASIQTCQAADDTALAVLRRRVAQQQRNDKELVIDPRLFIALCRQHPRVTGVKIRPHRGMAHNELTRFRYQAILEIEHPDSVTVDVDWQEWQPALTADRLHRQLESKPGLLGLRRIPNARLEREIAITEWLDNSGATEKTVGELRQNLANRIFNGLEPEALWLLGEELGYNVDIGWHNANSRGDCDVLFKRSDDESAQHAAFTLPKIPLKTWRDYANNPLQGQLGEKLIPLLRDYLSGQLPDHMMPSAFVVLDKLPLTPNGKIDRKALPDPESAAQPDGEYVAPRNAEEEKLAQIWAAVLGLEQVGIHDNFFELGGHSLLATQVVSRIRETFDIELPLRELFNAPSVAELSQTVRQLCHAGQDERAAPLVLPVIVPDADARHQPFPLNDIQQAYWLGRSDAFAMGNVAPHIYLELDCPRFDVQRLERAWQRTVKRHEMLRAVILADGQQQILPQVPAYRIETLDLSGRNPEAGQTRLDEIRQTMSDHVFDVSQWPLFEIRITRLNADRMRLHFSLDAIINDGWSTSILEREWWRFYQNPALEPEPLTLSFRDYVLAEQAWHQEAAYQNALNYWHKRLDSLPPAPQLPLARQPESLGKPRFNARSFKLNTAQWEALQQKTAKTGVTPSALLLTLFADILAMWSKSAHFTLNLTLFNRLPVHEQISRLVGDFTSLILLEIDNRQPATFSERARRVQQQLWQDLEHRYVSGVHVMREMASRNKDRQSAMPIVFTSMLALDIEQGDGVFNNLGEQVFGLGMTPQVWIDHGVIESAEGLDLLWSTVDDLFPDGLLDDMFAAYRQHIEQLLDSDSAAAGARSLLPEACLALQREVNATKAPQSEQFMHSLFIEQAEKQADRPAVISAVINGEVCLSYNELRAASLQLGHWLRQQGVTRNQLVAVVMDKGWEQIAAVMGILCAGAAYVPIDPELPEQRQHFLLLETEARIILTQSKWQDSLHFPRTVQILAVDRHDLPPCHTLPELADRKLSDLAYIIYTSGSTGNPKGVVIDHRGAVNTLADINRRFQVIAQDRVLALSALNFDLSVYDIFGVLGAGGTLVMPDPARRRDPLHWAELMRKHQVTLWNTVPALMQMLLDFQNGAPLDTPLRLALMSGDWIPLTLPERIRQLWPDCQTVSLGGATEASIWSICHPIDNVDHSKNSIPYGKPLDNQTFYVLNQHLQPCPIWTHGDLYIGGIGLAQGYWKDEAKTQAGFITHPQTGERLYKTGDLGRWLPDGNIEFLGREDAQVKVRGYRIELGEIETCLNRHPNVKEGVVTAIGEALQEKQLAAYIVPKNASVNAEDYGTETMKGALADPAERAAFKLRQPKDEIKAFLHNYLPSYMVPNHYVILEKLPLSANGKVDKKSLPVPDLNRIAKTREAPANETERLLMEMVISVLQTETVGVTDNFFDIGANSLDFIQIYNAIKNRWGIKITVMDLFRLANIREIAGLLDTHINAESDFEEGKL
ncbi:MAG: amino acid adenylation domain-containing protein [Gammaproteobacteria bacterium]|nr:amino acid adenylation domain-containing protein [Gammaproteobacteria bacterium]